MPTSKICNNCGNDIKGMPPVPYTVHEDAMARAERQSKRLVAIIILLILLLVGSNIGWLVYESQFETVESWGQEVVQEADNGENHFIGGDFIGETESKD